MKLYFLLANILMVSSSGVALAIETVTEARLDKVAEKGRMVMPFNLEQTLHIFTKKPLGGVQQIFSKDPKNKEQIRLIREHLVEKSADFKERNFSDPIKIHGEDMPGLSLLKQAKLNAITIKYKELPDGAEITYTSEEPNLIKAIQQWFDAQLRDHARHAVMHRSHHHKMKKELD